MRISFFSLCLLIFIGYSCTKEKEKSSKNFRPQYFEKILKAHGGISAWNQYRTLSFTVDSTDHYVIDTKDRRELINTPSYQLAHDGEHTWKKVKTALKTDPRFLKNLMFYFYAMPFVLADSGIVYQKIPAKNILGKSYEGIKVTFQDFMGVSPKDEYLLYFDKENAKMVWLAYTVTYFSNEKSEKYSWIKYDKWQKLNELLLPKQLTWYHQNKQGPTDIKRTKIFSKASIIKESKDKSFYTLSTSAILVE